MWLNLRYTKTSPSTNLLNVGVARSIHPVISTTISSGRPVISVYGSTNPLVIMTITLVDKGAFSTDIEAANAYASEMANAINLLNSGLNRPDSVVNFPPPFNLQALTITNPYVFYAY